MPDTKLRQYADLEDALRQKQYPLENWPIVRAFIAAIGCSLFEETTKYIKATRIKPSMALWIGSGWAEGFETKEEAEAAGGEAFWHGEHGWGFWLPINSAHEGGGGTSRTPVTSGEFCPKCHLELTASGECPLGDEL